MPITAHEIDDIARARVLALVKADMDAAIARQRQHLDEVLFQVRPSDFPAPRPLSVWERRYYRLGAYLRGWRLAGYTLWLALAGQTDKLEEDRDGY